MVQAANLGKLDDPAQLGSLDDPRLRRVAVQRQVTACPVVAVEVVAKDAAQVLLVQNDHMVQAVAP